MKVYGLIAAWLVVSGCDAQNPDADKDTLVVDTDSDTVDSDTVDSDTVPEGARATIRVVAPPSYAPLAGSPILVHDADGALVDETVTDADGEVEVTVPPGGSVSFVETAGSNRRVRTTFDVPDGATVNFQSSALNASPDTGGIVREFLVNATGTPAGVTSWEAHSYCGTRVSAQATSIPQDNTQCTSVTEHNVVVIGKNASGSPVAYGAVSGVAVERDGVVVNVPMAASAPRVVTLNVTGAPPEVSDAYLNASITPDQVRAFQASAHPGGFSGSVTREMELPAVPNGRLSLQIELVTTNGTIRSSLVTRTATNELDLDVSNVARVVPELDQTDPTRPEARWVVTPGDRGTAGGATLFWSPSEGPVGIWLVTFDPAARMSVRFPQMPASRAAYQPAQDDAISLSGVGFSSGSFGDTYAAWLGHDSSEEAFDIVTSTGEP